VCRQGIGRGCATIRRPGTGLSRLGVWRFFGRFRSLSDLLVQELEILRFGLTRRVEFEVFLQVGMPEVALLDG
jgi:hypothetical protein